MLHALATLGWIALGVFGLCFVAFLIVMACVWNSEIEGE